MKSLILLDIDGTLYDKKYVVNDLDLSSTIDALQKKGCVFALNSNRSVEDMTPVQKEFLIKGPIIAENGSIIKCCDEEFVLTKTGNIEKLKQTVKEIITNINSKVDIQESDTVSQIRNESFESKNKQKLVIFNKFRRLTMSIHVKRYVNNKIEKDIDFAKKIVNKINKTEKIMNEYDVTYSNAFGNILIFPKDTNKLIGFLELKYKFFKDYETIFIGDDSFDEKLAKNVDYFFTVRNAEENIKKIANFIAPEDYSKGVNYILKNINVLKRKTK